MLHCFPFSSLSAPQASLSVDLKSSLHTYPGSIHLAQVWLFSGDLDAVQTYLAVRVMMSTALQTPRLILPPIPHDMLAGALKRPRDLQSHSQSLWPGRSSQHQDGVHTGHPSLPSRTDTWVTPEHTLVPLIRMKFTSHLKEKVSADIHTIDSKGGIVFHVHLFSIEIKASTLKVAFSTRGKLDY